VVATLTEPLNPPATRTRRVPKRSPAQPLTAPSVKKRKAVTEKTTEVAPEPAWNSLAIGLKKEPKE